MAKPTSPKSASRFRQPDDVASAVGACLAPPRSRWSPPSAARLAVYGPILSAVLTYQPGSTVKLEQVIGDADYAAIARGNTIATTSKTVSQCNVAGCDLGQSFEHQGKLIFLFGHTISNDPSMPWSAGAAPMAQYLRRIVSAGARTPMASPACS